MGSVVRDLQERLGHHRRWGRDASLTPDVVSVRQNLDLLVDHGSRCLASMPRHLPMGRDAREPVYVWRSGMASPQTAPWSTSVARPSTSPAWPTSWSGAGAVRAMELDINTDWVNSRRLYAPTAPGPKPPPTTGPTCSRPWSGSPPGISSPTGPVISSPCPPSRNRPEPPPRPRPRGPRSRAEFRGPSAVAAVSSPCARGRSQNGWRSLYFWSLPVAVRSSAVAELHASWGP